MPNILVVFLVLPLAPLITAVPVAQDTCNIRTGECPIEDDPTPDWVKALNDPRDGYYRGSLDEADILPCKDLSTCMKAKSPLMTRATAYYGFEGCNAKQKRTIIQAQADALRMVRSVANYKLDWNNDPAVLELYGPPQRTANTRCRTLVPDTLKNLNNYYKGWTDWGSGKPGIQVRCDKPCRIQGANAYTWPTGSPPVLETVSFCPPFFNDPNLRTLDSMQSALDENPWAAFDLNTLADLKASVFTHEQMHLDAGPARVSYPNMADTEITIGPKNARETIPMYETGAIKLMAMSRADLAQHINCRNSETTVLFIAAAYFRRQTTNYPHLPRPWNPTFGRQDNLNSQFAQLENFVDAYSKQYPYRQGRHLNDNSTLDSINSPADIKGLEGTYPDLADRLSRDGRAPKVWGANNTGSSEEPLTVEVTDAVNRADFVGSPAEMGIIDVWGVAQETDAALQPSITGQLQPVVTGWGQK